VGNPRLTWSIRTSSAALESAFAGTPHEEGKAGRL
jgi:hypothetical protein